MDNLGNFGVWLGEGFVPRSRKFSHEDSKKLLKERVKVTADANFTWDLVRVHNKTLEIKVNFTSPWDLSVFRPDVLHVVVCDSFNATLQRKLD